MYGERIGEDAQTKTHLNSEAFFVVLAFFTVVASSPNLSTF